QPRRALGNGAIGVLFDASDAEPIVAETGVNAGLHKVWQVGCMNQAVGAKAQVAGVARVLITLDRVRSSVGIARRGYPFSGEHLRDESGPPPQVVARSFFRNQLGEAVGRAVGDKSR